MFPVKLFLLLIQFKRITSLLLPLKSSENMAGFALIEKKSPVAKLLLLLALLPVIKAVTRSNKMN